MTDSVPDWLPALLPFHGEWSTYVEEIYQAFRADMLRSRASFRKQRVGVRTEPRDQGKEAGFWHAISEGKDEYNRTPDLRRCERVRWIRPVIECDEETKVHIWESKRGSDRRAVLALLDFSYVVVLAIRKKYVLFLTAYCVEQEHRRRKLKKECTAWRDAQKS